MAGGDATHHQLGAPTQCCADVLWAGCQAYHTRATAEGCLGGNNGGTAVAHIPANDHDMTKVAFMGMARSPRQNVEELARRSEERRVGKEGRSGGGGSGGVRDG